MRQISINISQSFTLVELLIVIGILAILTAAIIIVLNPAELLKQARDSKRIQDLSGLENNINISQALAPNISLGTASTVYVSIADDTSSSCATLSLPSLPTGYEYACVTEDNLYNTDGTGWIPINFQDTELAGVITLASLPIDPTNATTTGLYYTYTTGGSYELTTILESDKYRSITADDGGDSFSVYEKGTDLVLSPYSDSGLVGYWPFEEGSGTTTEDMSGNGNTGTWMGSGNKEWVSGKVGYCPHIYNTWISVADSNLLDLATTDFSISFWVNQSSSDVNFSYVVTKAASGSYLGWGLGISGGNIMGEINPDDSRLSAITGVSKNEWYFVTMTTDRDAYIRMYINGNQKSLRDISAKNGLSLATDYALNFGSANNSAYQINQLEGYIDEVRIYNRALSVAEIQAIYNATR
jgi:type II secretory pathway pseudopilin PulG